MENLTIEHEIDRAARVLAMTALGVLDVCRRCGAPFSARVVESFKAGKRVKCSECDWYGNWRDNTPLARSTLLDIQFLALFYKFSLNDSTTDIAAALRISPTTVRKWRRRVQDIVREDANG